MSGDFYGVNIKLRLVSGSARAGFIPSQRTLQRSMRILHLLPQANDRNGGSKLPSQGVASNAELSGCLVPFVADVSPNSILQLYYLRDECVVKISDETPSPSSSWYQSSRCFVDPNVPLSCPSG